MSEEQSPARPLGMGMSNLAATAQIRAATRTLDAVTKSSAMRDVLPNLSQMAAMQATVASSVLAAMPKVEVPGLAAAQATLASSVLAAMPKVDLPKVAGVYATLGNSVLAAMPKIEMPGLAAAQATLASSVLAAMPKVDLPKVAGVYATLGSSVLAAMPKIEMPGLAVMQSTLASSVLAAMPNAHDFFSSTLRIWRDLADAGKAHARWARRALRAARNARDAVLRGDWAYVRDFVLQYLGLKHPQDAHLQAAADALLEPGWEPDEIGVWAVTDLLDNLRRNTLSGTRRHRPISQTRINRRTVVHLEQPLDFQDGTTVTLLDLVRDDTPVPEILDYGFDDDRLKQVLALLTPDERKVCLAYAGPGCTWRDAAVAAGFPPEFGESVRRKRTRVKNEVSRRAAARRGADINLERRGERWRRTPAGDTGRAA